MHTMARISSAAPLLGAALAAALMVTATIGFQAGAGARAGVAVDGLDAAPGVETRPVTARLGAMPRDDGSAPAETLAEADRPSARPQARLAVIIDDIADVQTAERLWSLGVPITLAVLPYADAAPEVAARARAAGREVFVHLPMEPVGLEDPGPNALTKALAPRDFRARLSWAFRRVPGAAGFNNHMGSRLTADRAAMAQLFANLADRSGDLIFVDSLTHSRSVAGEAAEAAGFRVLRRSVFLDHHRSPNAIDAQLDAALDEARARGEAIAIGHPYPMTLDALATLQARAAAAGVELTTVSALAAD